jgi:hypothetical protein
MVAVLSFVVGGSSCGGRASCPETVDQAVSGEFASVTERYVAVGRIARFVDPADPENRGYDLDVRRRLSGSVSADGTFLEVMDQLPGLTQGQAVLIVAEPGSNARVIVPGACTPLRAISDAELARWTGSP